MYKQTKYTAYERYSRDWFFLIYSILSRPIAADLFPSLIPGSWDSSPPLPWRPSYWSCYRIWFDYYFCGVIRSDLSRQPPSDPSHRSFTSSSTTFHFRSFHWSSFSVAVFFQYCTKKRGWPDVFRQWSVFFPTPSVVLTVRRYSSFLLCSSVRRELSLLRSRKSFSGFSYLKNETLVAVGFPIDTGQVSSPCATIRICIGSILSLDFSTNIEIQTVSAE